MQNRLVYWIIFGNFAKIDENRFEWDLAKRIDGKLKDMGNKVFFMEWFILVF